jgi:hypothetical protein
MYGILFRFLLLANYVHFLSKFCFKVHSNISNEVHLVWHSVFPNACQFLNENAVLGF